MRVLLGSGARTVGTRNVPAVRIAIFFQCMCFAPEGFFDKGEPSPAFPTVLVPLPPRQSGVGARGDRNWICWREWRRASPYLLPHPSDSAGKPARRSLPPGARDEQLIWLSAPPRRPPVLCSPGGSGEASVVDPVR